MSNSRGAMVSLTAELTGYRKGTTRVMFSFDKSLIRWRESTRWTRNFMRTFDPGDQVLLERALNEVSLEAWPTHSPDEQTVMGETAYRRMWHLVAVYEKGEPLECWGKDAYPAGFPYLVEVISEICHQLFRVDD